MSALTTDCSAGLGGPDSHVCLGMDAFRMTVVTWKSLQIMPARAFVFVPIPETMLRGPVSALANAGLVDSLERQSSPGIFGIRGDTHANFEVAEALHHIYHIPNRADL